MSQYPSDTGMSQQKPKKSWFGRNWWWVLLLVLGLPLACCGGIIGLGFWGFNKGMEELKKMPPYADSVQLIETDPRATAALGTPVEVAGIFEGASQGYQFNVSETFFDAQLPVSGPNGSGVLIIDAELDLSSGNWVYDTQKLELPDGTEIDFLAAGSATTPAGGGDSDREIPDQE